MTFLYYLCFQQSHCPDCIFPKVICKYRVFDCYMWCNQRLGLQVYLEFITVKDDEQVARLFTRPPLIPQRWSFSNLRRSYRRCAVGSL